MNGSADVTYDNNFRLVKQRVNGADSVTFQYDNDGLLTGAGSLTLTRNSANGLLTGTTLSAVTTGQTYNTFGELAGYTARFGSDTLFQTVYTRDALGRISRQIETVEVTTDTLDYAYDQVGRLMEVQRNGIVAESYEYDSNGNRTSSTSPSGTVTATYDDQDRLLTFAAATYSYTGAGELAMKVVGPDTTLYNYDQMGNLVEVQLPDATLIEYFIDGQNRRVGKKVNGALIQAFVHGERLNPFAELDSLGNIVAVFVYGSHYNVPEYVRKGGSIYRVVTDHVGSVREVVHASTGQIVQRIDYDAYGHSVQNTNPDFQPFTFAGGLADSHSGLIHFAARDYDPVTGRWTRKDPKGFGGGTSNLYAYAAEDPVNYIDPTGEQSIRIPRPGAPSVPVVPEWPAEPLAEALQDLLDWHHDAVWTVDAFCVGTVEMRIKWWQEALAGC